MPLMLVAPGAAADLFCLGLARHTTCNSKLSGPSTHHHHYYRYFITSTSIHFQGFAVVTRNKLPACLPACLPICVCSMSVCPVYPPSPVEARPSSSATSLSSLFLRVHFIKLRLPNLHNIHTSQPQSYAVNTYIVIIIISISLLTF
jgi:hypothetical protein